MQVPNATSTRSRSGSPDLRLDGNTVRAGNYEIRVERDRVVITDVRNGKQIEMWGDPHLRTSDGDAAQFQRNNLTIDLPDGTKVSVKPTEPDANGVSYVDSVAIMKGDDGVEFTDVHDGNHGPQASRELSSRSLDALYDDGTVLHARTELDDLFFSNGRELVGTDPTKRWNEHELDGQGGTSEIDFLTRSLEDIVSRFESEFQSRIPTGGSIEETIMALLAGLDEERKDLLSEFQKLGDQRRVQSALLRSRDTLEQDIRDLEASNRPDKEAALEILTRKRDEIDQKLARFPDFDTEMQKLQLRLQKVEQMRQELFTLVSNASKNAHDVKMTIINNSRLA